MLHTSRSFLDPGPWARKPWFLGVFLKERTEVEIVLEANPHVCGFVRSDGQPRLASEGLFGEIDIAVMGSVDDINVYSLIEAVKREYPNVVHDEEQHTDE